MDGVLLIIIIIHKTETNLPQQFKNPQKSKHILIIHTQNAKEWGFLQNLSPRSLLVNQDSKIFRDKKTSDNFDLKGGDRFEKLGGDENCKSVTIPDAVAMVECRKSSAKAAENVLEK